MAAYSRGSRTESRSHPRAQFIRFTSEENERLIRLCRKRKLTVQSFMHAATMRALNEADVGKKTDAEDEQESAERERAARDKPAAPRGLGIRDRLQRAERDDEPDETPSSTPAPVPAQPQTHVTSADVEILALARTIVEAPVSTRRDVLASACRTLARGRSQEEAIRLAEELDATIKRLDGVPRTALDRVRARMK